MLKNVEKMSLNYSPNFYLKKRSISKVKYLIFHYTGMKSENGAIKKLTNKNSKVSCHYFIKRNGLVILMVPDIYEAWHAGKSNWKKDNLLNSKSIGIEISNKGHQFGYQNFTKKQIKSLVKLSKFLIKKYILKKENILGHSDIAVERKKDPGEKFPWELLSKNKIGFWHRLNKYKLQKSRNIEVSKNEEIIFFKNLSKIGYYLKFKAPQEKIKLIKSFQRHFRQKIINGKIDQETMLIAENLIKNKI